MRMNNVLYINYTIPFNFSLLTGQDCCAPTVFGKLSCVLCFPGFKCWYKMHTSNEKSLFLIHMLIFLSSVSILHHTSARYFCIVKNLFFFPFWLKCYLFIDIIILSVELYSLSQLRMLSLVGQKVYWPARIAIYAILTSVILAVDIIGSASMLLLLQVVLRICCAILFIAL